MKVLVLNCGSSSLKYQLIDMDTEDVIAKGNFERIGEQESFLTHKMDDKKFKIETYVKNHEEALDIIIKELLNEEHKAIDSLDEINAIGHRLVHGGEKISESVVINEEVIIEAMKWAVAECQPALELQKKLHVIRLEY